MGMRHIDSLNGYYLANDHITTQLRVCVCVCGCVEGVRYMVNGDSLAYYSTKHNQPY